MRSKRITIGFLVALVFLASCGSGGLIDFGGKTIPEPEDEGADLITENLPGTNQQELFAGDFDVVVELGAAVSVVDMQTEDGRWEVKSNLLFSN